MEIQGILEDTSVFKSSVWIGLQHKAKIVKQGDMMKYDCVGFEHRNTTFRNMPKHYIQIVIARSQIAASVFSLHRTEQHLETSRILVVVASFCHILPLVVAMVGPEAEALQLPISSFRSTYPAIEQLDGRKVRRKSMRIPGIITGNITNYIIMNKT